MIRPCPQKIDCEGTDFPITNYSAEGPETPPTWPAIVWPMRWDAMGCLSLCVSELSQDDADLCALAQEAQCQPPPPPELDRFLNTAQTCFRTCPDGSGTSFSYTVPSGTFSADTQAAADDQAYALACTWAAYRVVCLGPLTTPCCEGGAYSHTIAVTGGTPIFWTVSSGSLPPGLNLTQSGHVQGTPTASGSYTFVIAAYLANGSLATRSYNICVIGIDPATLPDATNGTAYSQTFTAPSCGGTPLSWSLAADSDDLPNGLTLDATTGVLSGTPSDVAGVYDLVIQVDTPTTFCQKEYELTLISAADRLYYWTLEEASGDRVDSNHGVHLVPFTGGLGPPPTGLVRHQQGAGKVAFGVNIYPDPAGQFQTNVGDTASGPAALAHTASSFSLAGWLKINSLGTAYGATGYAGFPATCASMWMHFVTGTILFRSSHGAGIEPVDISGIYPGVGVWFFFHMFYDSTSGKFGISFNNGAETLATVAGAVTPASTGTVYMWQGGFAPPNDYTSDEYLLKLDGKLTPAQLAYLYNGGAGRTWPIVLP